MMQKKPTAMRVCIVKNASYHSYAIDISNCIAHVVSTTQRWIYQWHRNTLLAYAYHIRIVCVCVRAKLSLSFDFKLVILISEYEMRKEGMPTERKCENAILKSRKKLDTQNRTEEKKRERQRERAHKLKFESTIGTDAYVWYIFMHMMTIW